MKFQDNFSETHLLFNINVDFIIYDEQKQNNIQYFQLVLPTFRDCYFDYRIQNFLYIINAPLQDITKNIKGISDIKSLFVLCKNLYAFSDANLFYHDVIKYSLNKFLPQLEYDNYNLQICGYTVTQELFDRIITLLLIAAGQKKLSELSIIDPAMREAQERINKIKKQKQNNVAGGFSSFNDSYMILTYEFHYTPEQILNMTMYCINTILKYTSKSINYKISLIGAGNGLSKKVHFITEKGK